MLVSIVGGTLLNVIKLGSNFKNDSEYIGQPSILVHLIDALDDDGEKNDFDCCIKAGLSSVSISM